MTEETQRGRSRHRAEQYLCMVSKVEQPGLAEMWYWVLIIRALEPLQPHLISMTTSVSQVREVRLLALDLRRLMGPSTFGAQYLCLTRSSLHCTRDGTGGGSAHSEHRVGSGIIIVCVSPERLSLTSGHVSLQEASLNLFSGWATSATKGPLTDTWCYPTNSQDSQAKGQDRSSLALRNEISREKIGGGIVLAS